MKTSSSARGARRGLMLASVFVALWGSWALGYLQGSGYFNGATQPKASATRVQANGGAA